MRWFKGYAKVSMCSDGESNAWIDKGSIVYLNKYIDEDEDVRVRVIEPLGLKIVDLTAEETNKYFMPFTRQGRFVEDHTKIAVNAWNKYNKGLDNG